MKTRMFIISVLLFVMIFSLGLPVNTAFAANGDLIASVTFSQDCISELGVGIDFDGTNLWVSCAGASPDLLKADPITGAVLSSYTITGDLGALSYDSTRNVMWAASPPNQVWRINLDANKNVVDYALAFTVGDSCSIIDGMAFDSRSLA